MALGGKTLAHVVKLDISAMVRGLWRVSNGHPFFSRQACWQHNLVDLSFKWEHAKEILLAMYHHFHWPFHCEKFEGSAQREGVKNQNFLKHSLFCAPCYPFCGTKFRYREWLFSSCDVVPWPKVEGNYTITSKYFILFWRSNAPSAGKWDNVCWFFFV